MKLLQSAPEAAGEEDGGRDIVSPPPHLNKSDKCTQQTGIPGNRGQRGQSWIHTYIKCMSMKNTHTQQGIITSDVTQRVTGFRADRHLSSFRSVSQIKANR